MDINAFRGKYGGGKPLAPSSNSGVNLDSFRVKYGGAGYAEEQKKKKKRDEEMALQRETERIAQEEQARQAQPAEEVPDIHPQPEDALNHQPSLWEQVKKGFSDSLSQKTFPVLGITGLPGVNNFLDKKIFGGKIQEADKIIDDNEPIKMFLNSEPGKRITGTVADNTSNLPLKGMARIQSAGDKTYEEAKNALLEQRNNPDNPYWQQLLWDVQDSGAQSAVGALLAISTSLLTKSPTAGRAVAGGYFSAISAEEQRKTKGEVKSLGNIGIDTVGDTIISGFAEATLKSVIKEGGKSFAKNLAKKAGQGFLVEGTTEPTQTLLKYANDYRNAQSDDDKRAVIAEMTQYVKSGGMIHEFLVGGISGAGITAGAMGAGKLMGGEAPVEPSMLPHAPAEEEQPEKQTPAYNPNQKVQNFVMALGQNDSEGAAEVATALSTGELQKALTILDQAKEKTDNELQVQSIENHQSQIQQIIEARRDKVGNVANEIAKNNIVDEEKMKDLSPGERKQVGDVLSNLAEQTGKEMPTVAPITRIPYAEEWSVHDTEKSPFYEKNAEEQDQIWEEKSNELLQKIEELKAEKNKMLGEKKAMLTKESKKEIQVKIDKTDAQIRQYATSNDALENQFLGARGREAQRVVDQIFKVVPDFDLADAIENGWDYADYKVYLEGVVGNKKLDEEYRNEKKNYIANVDQNDKSGKFWFSGSTRKLTEAEAKEKLEKGKIREQTEEDIAPKRMVEITNPDGTKEEMSWGDYLKRKNSIKKGTFSQKEKVAEAIKEKPKTIKEIAKETKILEPNVRRILGVGAKEGTFERVDKGVYILSKDGQDIAYVHTGDAIETLPKLAADGFKADMVFLDIPYKTPAVTGGNRGIKFETVSVDDFRKVMSAVSDIVRDENSPVYYMYSKAPSGMKQMMKYNDVLIEKGFKPIAEGGLTKLQKDGLTIVRNMRGAEIPPEGIILLNKSGKFDEIDEARKLDFRLIRPKGYQTEKPADLLRSLIMQGTKEGDTVLDPFAGSGVTGEQAVKTGRKTVLIEKNPKAVEEHIKPKLRKAAEEKKKKPPVLPTVEELAKKNRRLNVTGNETGATILEVKNGKGTLYYTDEGAFTGHKTEVATDKEDGVYNLGRKMDTEKTLEAMKSFFTGNENYGKKISVDKAQLRKNINLVSAFLEKGQGGSIYFVVRNNIAYLYSKSKQLGESSVELGTYKIDDIAIAVNPELFVDVLKNNKAKEIILQIPSKNRVPVRIGQSVLMPQVGEGIDIEPEKVGEFLEDFPDTVMASLDAITDGKINKRLLTDKNILKQIDRINKEVNPAVRDMVKLTIATRMIDLDGVESRGEVNTETGEMTISRDQTKAQLRETYREEIGHLAGRFLTRKQRMVIMNYYNSFSEEEKREHFGKNSNGEDVYDIYNRKYRGNPFLVAEEFVLKEIRNKDYSSPIVRAYLRAMREIIRFINRVVGLMDRYVKGINSKELYESVFDLESDLVDYKGWRDLSGGTRMFNVGEGGKSVADIYKSIFDEMNEAEYADEFNQEYDALNAKKWKIEMPSEPVTDKTINKTEIMTWIGKTFGVPLKMKATSKWRSAGVYYPKQQIVRMEKWGELSVVTHEIAHHLDYQYRRILGRNWYRPTPKIVKELADLDYDEKKRRTNEGFAEYMRHRLTTDQADKLAPEFHKFFNEFLDKNPELKEKITTLREKLDVWHGQGAENRVIQHIDWKGEHTKVKGIANLKAKSFRFLQEKFNDEFYVSQKIVGEIEKTIGRKLNPTENPAVMMEYSKSKAGAIARTFVMDKAIDEYGNVTGKGLAEILKPVPKKEMQQFIAYAVSLRAKNLEDRNIESGFDIDDAKFILEKYKDKGWDSVAGEMTKWSDNFIDWIIRAGGISEDVAQKVRELNPLYIPLKRAFLEETAVIKQGTGGYVDTGSGIKRIKGSGRPIINPVESLIAQSRELIAKAQKIKIAKLFADLAENEGVGGFITKVPAPMQATTFSANQIKDYLQEQMGEFIVGDLEDVLTVFTQGTQYTGKENIVSVWKNGKQQFYEIHPELYEAMKGIDPLKLGPVGKLLAPFSRGVRLGATGLKFSFGLARNPFRDAFSYAVFSKRKTASIFDPIKGVYTDLTAKEGSATWRFKAMGGALSGQVGYDRAATMSTYDEMLTRKLGKKGKILRVARHPVDTLRAVLSVTELGPRSAELEANYNMYRKENTNWSEEDCFVQAFNDAQDVTVNFTKSGKWAKQLNEITAFFNVAIRGPEKTYRSFKERPVATIVKSLLWLTLPMLFLWKENKDKEWYKNLPPSYKYNNVFYEIGDTVIRLPIPFELGTIFMAAPQAALDASGGDAGALEGVADIIKYQVPNPTPSAFKPFIDVAANKNYLNQPIESEGMQHQYPTERRKSNTSQFAIYLSKGFDRLGMKLSPVQLDYLMESYSGGFTRQFDKTGTPVIEDLTLRDPNYPTRQLNDFFSDWEVLSQKKSSKILTLDERKKLAKIDGFYQTFLDINKAIKRSREEKNDAKTQEYYARLKDILLRYGYDGR